MPAPSPKFTVPSRAHPASVPPISPESRRDGGVMQENSALMRGRKIGFIGGGNMASALIRGLLHSATVTPEQIRASDVKSDRLTELHTKYGIVAGDDNEELGRWADVIVIAV